MITKVIMPKLSDAMETGKVIKWLKKEGEAVKGGDILVEVETDKANVEVEAFGSGVLRKIVIAEGGQVPVGDLIAVIADPAEDISSVAASPAHSTSSTRRTSAVSSGSLMAWGVVPRRRHIVSEGECARDRLDPIAAAEAGDEGMGEGGICEIKPDRIVDDAGEPGRSQGPAFDPTGLVEPSMDDLKLAPKPLRRHRDPHPHRKLPVGLALRQHRSPCHTCPPFMVRSSRLSDGSVSVERWVDGAQYFHLQGMYRPTACYRNPGNDSDDVAQLGHPAPASPGDRPRATLWRQNSQPRQASQRRKRREKRQLRDWQPW